MLGGSNIFSALGDIEGTITLTVVCIIILAGLILVKLTNLPFFKLLKQFGMSVYNLLGKFLKKREKLYHRDLEIGKIDEKRNTVKIYRFLSDLIIDLELSDSGITPYELLFLTITGCFLGSEIICKFLFGTWFMGLVMFPIVTIAIFCFMYTKANLAHDVRIESVIEAENIICNNIKIGVVPAVRDSLSAMPKEVRSDFRDFVDNVEYKNCHIKTALQELNAKLGGIADDFIKKCIMFEMEEEHGVSGIFKDVVEINNIKMQMRTEMKRRFEEVLNEFKMGALMIFGFLGGVIALYPNVREFYFNSIIGNLVLAIDALILIAEFVYITYLRAQEL